MNSYKPKPRSGTSVFGRTYDPPVSSRVPPNIIALMILQALDYQSGVEDPAIQNAIDWMVQKMYMNGRSQLFDFLKREYEAPDDGRRSLIAAAILEAWTDNRKLKKATGRSRDEWLALI